MQKVCSPKTLLCLTLSTYLVLQQLSLFQTKPKPLNPILQSRSEKNPKPQINQTFHSTILVFIIVVSLHSDAYLRSFTLSHKIGGEQNVLDQYNLAKNVLDQFFSLQESHPKECDANNLRFWGEVTKVVG